MPTRRLVASLASFSWINPSTGLPEVDKNGEPGESIAREEVFAGAKYRFSNYLEAVVDVDDRLGIARAAFGEPSGMYRGPSFLRLDSAPVGRIGRRLSYTRDEAVFRQLVGCRTESPEKIGSGVGAVAGAGVGVAGVVAGAKLGAIGGAWAGPPGMFIGAVAIGTVGYFAGREVAELATAFPPIWTELELAVKADGSLRCALVSHSLFPSNTLYGCDPLQATPAAAARLRQIGTSYDGDGVRLKNWKEGGWGMSAPNRAGPTAGNPWGMSDPGPTLGRSPLQREVPQGYDG